MLYKIKNPISICVDRISNDCLLSDNKFVKIYNFLLINKFNIVDNHKLSEIIILDLCWVNSEFLIETSKKIDLYLLLNKKIILLWCISKIFKEKYKEKLIYIDSKNYKDFEIYFEFNIWFDKIDSINFKNKLTILDTDSSLKNYSYTLTDFEKISFVSISDGCSLNCSYCNIKKIKWDTISSKEEDILNEIKNWVSNWKKNIYLLSDDCWSYWIDKWTNLVDLIDKIFEIDEKIKLNITNIYPLFFIKYYDKLKKYIYLNKIWSIVVPVQHTSDRILWLMNRKYNIEKLIEILDDINKNSKVQLQNHIIFDYHNETVEEFVDTFKLLNYYDKNFYFRYSDVNSIYGKDFISNNLKEKIVLLKKLQNKYNIDITL